MVSAISSTIRFLSVYVLPQTSGAGSIPIYFYVYNKSTAPTSEDAATFKFVVTTTTPINIPLNYLFSLGIGIRATTDKDGTTSPDVNTVFVNMTLN